MNFFEHQAIARSNTFRLLGVFVLAVVCVVGFWAGVVWLIGHYYLKNVLPHLVIPSAIVLLVTIVVATLYRISVLAQGGHIVAQELGGQELNSPSDFYTKRLQNIVEEMALASGIPIPRVFILPHDMGVNAFAAGYSPNSAVIAVTQGALTRLNRNELQGLVAHEFSHILNGDMRLNIIMVGTVFGLLFLSLMGGRLLEIFAHTRNSNNALIVFPLLLIALGSVGALAGRLIKASVSRQREYLADASAVQFTRDPQGIAGALKKAAGLSSAHAPSSEYAHLFFHTGPLNRWWNNVLVSHPPLLDRVKRLDPSFAEHSLLRAQRKWENNPPDGFNEDVRLGFVGQEGIAESSLKFSLLPTELLSLSHHPEGAEALLYALIICSQNTTQLTVSRSYLSSHIPSSVFSMVDDGIVLLNSMEEEKTSVVLRLALSALHKSSYNQWKRIEDNILILIHMGDHISLRQYCVGQSVVLSLCEWRQPRSNSTANNSLNNARTEIVKLLNAVAFFGNPSYDMAARAFSQGRQQVFPLESISYTPPFEGVHVLRYIWKPLQHLRPYDKNKLLEAVVKIVCHDEIIHPNEEDLLEVVCVALNCPIPDLPCKR